MKSKDKFSLEDDYTSSRKKHTKCQEFASKRKFDDTFEPGLVTDKLGQIINIGDIVQTKLKGCKQLIPCEVIEIHAENTLTVIHDDLESNQVKTYNVNAWDVTIIN